MNVSPIRFGSVSYQEFQDLVSKPQAYTMQNTPAASTPVEDKSSKKGGVLKKILIATGIAAAIAAALAYGAKKGVFKVADPSKGNQFLNGIKSALNTAGNFILDLFTKDTKKPLRDAAKTIAEEATEKGTDVVKDIAEEAGKVAEKSSQLVNP